MVLEYHKHKKGRILNRGSSPRDLQNRNVHTVDNSTEMYSELLHQLAKVQAELDNVKREKVSPSPATSVYTEEDFNEALEKALLKEINNLEKEYKVQLKEKDTIIKSLKESIKIKEDTIEALQKALSNIPTNITVSTTSNSDVVSSKDTSISDRPAIQEEIIDPSEDPELESHITIESTVEDNSEIMSNKLDKLKNILG